jgi:hypothetical protein
MAMTIHVDEQETAVTETITLHIEELEERIAPMVQQDFHRSNHNETLVRGTE